MDTEELWRAALHDFNNLMAGLQGVLDLSDPGLPLDSRNRLRLGSILEDGKTLVAMARALALSRIPDAGLAAWGEWEAGLRHRLVPVADLFRCPVDLVDAGAATYPWPAPLFQDWALAFTRQLLPWAVPGPLRLEAEVGENGWELRWITDAPLPSALQLSPPADALRNLPSFWLRSMADQLRLTVKAEGGAIRIRMPLPVVDGQIRVS
ncbi:hypothetical protein [Geothrix sp. 21YS21S-4]|uniref:hypothetical protein n=1 Tax=Geothrix sp. 21YS21S-4 TaxID=3068889 RepID=UPI0027B8A36C|nr:hypothetical protein [Geothrix sp. 21YS21S-4]